MSNVRTCIIVGAGIAGLAAAIRIRAAGFHVTVYDQNDYVGGKLAELRLQGYRFDMGPSLFTMPQYIADLFAIAERDMDTYFSYHRESEICRYHFEDGSHFTAPGDMEKFVEEASAIFDVDPQILRDYFRSNALKFNRTKSIFLENSLHKLRSYLRLDILRGIWAMPRLDMHTNLHALNQKKFRDPRLVQLFDRYATYNGSSPYRAPGIMSLIAHLEQYDGTYYPKGGMASIPKALHRLATDMGVDFTLNTKVDQIMTKGKKVQGIRIGENTKRADLVVCNADVFNAYRFLLPQLQAPKRTLEQERSSSGIIFYWGMNRMTPSLNLHNIFFAADYRKEFNWISEGGPWHHDPTIYINISSKVDPTDAPPGGENWFVMVNVPARADEDWAHWTGIIKKAVIQKLNRMLGFDVSEHIICEDILTPDLIETRTSSYLGALYGSASNDRLAAFLRHPNFHSSVNGLYFCGGSVHPGGGIPLCLLSGKIVADLITKNK